MDTFKTPIRRHLTRRRGITSVLAMLYLVLFSALAVGFYAATNTQTQIASNDERVARAFFACESGMDFMRYQLARVSVPPATPVDQVVDELYADLETQLNSTGNLTAIEKVGNTISIPATGHIQLDGGNDSRFRAIITDWAGEIVVKVEGQSGGLSTTRAITMDFSRATKPSTVFDYAVASKGQIYMKKGAVTSVAGVDPIIATMMSALAADPAIDVRGGTIGGDLSVTDMGTVDVSGGNVGGSNIPSVIMSDHVHEVEAPEFPTIDTDIYRQYATNSFVSGARTQQNIIIPANTNPQFNGGDTVQGIMYIESPNVVTFRGNFNLQGFIVFENDGDSSENVLDFRGNVSQAPLPSGSAFDPLRSTSGVAILGPTAAVTMSGSTDSFLRGSVIVGSFNFKGSADIQIDQGTLMTYNETNNACVFDGKTVKFTGTGSSNTPTVGLTYSSYYQPNPTSYTEVAP